MDYSDVVMQICVELTSVWGGLAPQIMKRRFQEVGASMDNPTEDGLKLFIKLLEEKALVEMYGPELAKKKASAYLRWVKNVRGAS